MNTLFFTSDTHFGHSSILHLTKRPFSTTEEMDEKLIENWNERVGKGDTVYHLGDFSLKQSFSQASIIRSRLNGQIHFIEGNHDSIALQLKHSFSSYRPYHSLKVGEQKIILFHYPIRSWDGIFKGSWHLHGHTHGLLPSFGKSFDIGVDSHNFYPLSFEEVKERMNKLPLVTEEYGFENYGKEGLKK